MSASERLAALEHPARPYWDDGAVDQESIKAANRCVDALVDALPEIVAVVRAAEGMEFFDMDGEGGYFIRSHDDYHEELLVKALAALDAKLERE